jgi:hypothetical protein
MCANSREKKDVYSSFSIHQLYKHEQYAVDVGITYTFSLFVKIGATTKYIFAPFKIIVFPVAGRCP